MNLSISQADFSVQNTAQGFSLLELLIALSVFSIGLLGVLTLQLTAMKEAHLTLLHSQAERQVSNFAESYRVSSLGMNQAIWENENRLYLPHAQSKTSTTEVRLLWLAHASPQAVVLRIE